MENGWQNKRRELKMRRTGILEKKSKGSKAVKKKDDVDFFAEWWGTISGKSARRV